MLLFVLFALTPQTKASYSVEGLYQLMSKYGTLKLAKILSIYLEL